MAEAHQTKAGRKRRAASPPLAASVSSSVQRRNAFHFLSEHPKLGAALFFLAVAITFSAQKSNPAVVWVALALSGLFFIAMVATAGLRANRMIIAICVVVLLTALAGYVLNQPPLVNIMFVKSEKPLPSIGPWRQYRIRRAITLFRNYLSDDVGFDIPRAVPPIAVSLVFGPGSQSLNDRAIVLGPQYIDEDREVVAQYATTVFGPLFPSEVGTTSAGLSYALKQLYGSYFTDSYYGSLGRYQNPMIQALWDMRSNPRLGVSFVDHSMFEALAQLKKYKSEPCVADFPTCDPKIPFATLVADSFISGSLEILVGVGDRSVEDTLKKYGIMP